MSNDLMMFTLSVCRPETLKRSVAVFFVWLVAGAALPHSADAKPGPIRMYVAYMQVELQAEAREDTLAVSTATGSRVLSCKRQSRTAGLCKAVYWGSSPVMAPDGSSGYNHIDCYERVRVRGRSRTTDPGGFSPILKVLGPPDCREYVSAEAEPSIAEAG